MQTKEVQMERSGEKQRSDMQLSNNQLMHAHASDSACTLRWTQGSIRLRHLICPLGWGGGEKALQEMVKRSERLWTKGSKDLLPLISIHPLLYRRCRDLDTVDVVHLPVIRGCYIIQRITSCKKWYWIHWQKVKETDQGGCEMKEVKRKSWTRCRRSVLDGRAGEWLPVTFGPGQHRCRQDCRLRFHTHTGESCSMARSVEWSFHTPPKTDRNTGM